MSAPDGGPAFPVRGIDALGVGMEMVEAKGLTVRDWFAGQALKGIIGHENGPAGDWKLCARNAYEAADAMLAERSEDQP